MAVITGAVTDEEKAELRRLTAKLTSFRQQSMSLPEATEIR
jgi:hypothetical protein